MVLERRVLGYLSWQGLSVLAQAGVQIGLIAILARFLSPAEFGLVAAANIAVTLAQMFAEGGVGSAVVRQPDLTPAFAGTALAMAVVVGGVCFVLTLLVAHPFEQFFRMEGLAEVLVVLGLSSLLAGASGVLEGILQRDLRFAALFRVNIVASVLGQAVPALVLAALGAGVWAIVAGTLGRLVVKCVALAWVARGRVAFRWDRNEGRQLLRFGFGLTRDRLWNWLGAQVPTLAVGLLFGQALLGQFSMATQLATLPFQHLSTVISTVFFPLVSRTLADPVQAGRQFLAVLAVVFLPMTAMGLALAVSAEEVVRLAFGPGWSAAVPVFAVLCLAAGVRGCIQVADTVNIARGDVHRLANRRLVSTIILALALFLGHSAGIVSGAWAIVAGHLAMLALTLQLAIRGLGLTGTLGRPVLGRLGLAMLPVAGVNLLLLAMREGALMGGTLLLACGIIVNVLVLVPAYLLVRPVLPARSVPEEGRLMPGRLEET